MKISEILYEHFEFTPTLSEFIDSLIEFDFRNCDGYQGMDNIKIKFLLILKYNDFLKQLIKLKMLVPCKDGEVLDKTLHEKLCKTGKTFGIKEQQKCYEYQKAKEGVLFSGFYIKRETEHGKMVYKTIDDEHENFWGCFTPDGKWKRLGDTDIEKISDLSGQPITEHYFKFLD